MKKEEKGFLICLVLVIGMMSAVLFHYYQGQVLHRLWPYNSFLFNPEDAWNDFFNIFVPMKVAGPFSTHLSIYCPFTYAVLYLGIGLKPVIAFLLLIFAFLSFAAGFVYHSLSDIPKYARALTTTILILMSYPVLYCIDRGNLEMLVFIFLSLFIYFYRKGNISLAIVFLAGAGAMKIYPLAFGVLLIIDRRYKAVAQTAVLTLLAAIIPCLFFPGGLKESLLGLGGNLHILQRQVKAGLSGLWYCDSIFAVLMLWGHHVLNQPFPVVYSYIEWVYPGICVILFGLMTAYLFRASMPFWKTATLLTFSVILFPQMSHDYKLIHVLIPLTAFIAAPSESRRGDMLFALLFGLLLIPKAYYFIWNDTHIGVFLNPLLMCLMVGLILKNPFPKRVEQPSLA